MKIREMERKIMERKGRMEEWRQIRLGGREKIYRIKRDEDREMEREMMERRGKEDANKGKRKVRKSKNKGRDQKGRRK